MGGGSKKKNSGGGGAQEKIKPQDPQLFSKEDIQNYNTHSL